MVRDKALAPVRKIWSGKAGKHPSCQNQRYGLGAEMFRGGIGNGEPVKLGKTGEQALEKTAEGQQVEIGEEDGGGAGQATGHGEHGTADEAGFPPDPARE